MHAGHLGQLFEEGGVLAPQSGLPLGGHAAHYLVFGIGLVVFLLLVARLLYKEYRRTGRWQLPPD